jgi:hypothetical protein
MADVEVDAAMLEARQKMIAKRFGGGVGATVGGESMRDNVTPSIVGRKCKWQSSRRRLAGWHFNNDTCAARTQPCGLCIARQPTA